MSPRQSFNDDHWIRLTVIIFVLGLMSIDLGHNLDQIHKDLQNLKPAPVSTPAPVSDHGCLSPLCRVVVPTTTPTPRVTPSAASRSRRIPRVVETGLNWTALRQCENSGLYTSKPGDDYRGAYQFDYGTWRSVGGSGDPAAASPGEQDYRARLLYAERGRSPWPVCGRLL